VKREQTDGACVRGLDASRPYPMLCEAMLYEESLLTLWSVICAVTGA